MSIDLIFGLRGQTAEDWRRELAAAVALEPQHLSCYQLTIHPRTRFGVQAKHGQLSELPEDDQATLFELTHRFLADAGWPAYEVSNFARGRPTSRGTTASTGTTRRTSASARRRTPSPARRPLVERAQAAALGEAARGG